MKQLLASKSLHCLRMSLYIFYFTFENESLQKITSAVTEGNWNGPIWDCDDSIWNEHSGMVILVALVKRAGWLEGAQWFNWSREWWAAESWFKESMPIPMLIPVLLSATRPIHISEACRGGRTPDKYIGCRCKLFLIVNICEGDQLFEYNH